VILQNERLSVTFVATGAANVRFWIKRLAPGDTYASYDLAALFDKPIEKSVKETYGDQPRIHKVWDKPNMITRKAFDEPHGKGFDCFKPSIAARVRTDSDC
jgi:hypothetical protein